MTHIPNGTATGGVRTLLRIEGLAVGLAAIALYATTDAAWWLFAALILAPDLAMVFYAFGPRVGAAAYNAAHSYVAPLAIGAALMGAGAPLALPITAIWLAHIGLDRAMGYGLKYSAGFKVTHLGP